MELLESQKLHSIVEQIFESRRKSHDIRWQMLFRDRSTTNKTLGHHHDDFNDDLDAQGVHINPAVDCEIADIIYSYQKYNYSIDRDRFDFGEDALLTLLSMTMKPDIIQKTMGQHLTTSTLINLAFLWRNVMIIKSFDGLLAQFLEEFLTIIKRLPPLSLSIIWNDSQEQSSPSTTSGDGEDKSSITFPQAMLSISELGYLANDRIIDFHDPFGIVERFFETVEQYALNPSPSAENRSLLLSVCIALAIKSGRVSFLLRTAFWMQDNQDLTISFDPSLIQDLVDIVGPISNDSIDEKKTAAVNEIIQRRRAAVEVKQTGKPIVTELDESDTTNYVGFNESLRIRRAEDCIALSFGKADHGKLGHGDAQVHRLVPTVIESLQHGGIMKVASMSTYAIAIDSLGNPYVWGTGGATSSTIGMRADIQPQLLEALPNKAIVRDIACGLGHALFLVDGGKVFAWGNGGNGRLGLGNSSDRTDSCLITALAGERITSVYCGASHSLALSDSGIVYSWGKNSQGQCGVGHNEDVLKPMANAALRPYTVIQIVAGWEHTIALTSEGHLHAWGCGYKDSRRGVIPPVLGLGHNEGRMLPEKITSLDGIVIARVASGWDHCLALDNKGKVLSWGSGQNGKLGHGGEENISIPCYIPSLESIKVVQIAAGCEHSAIISDLGVLYTWGHGDGGRLGHGDNGPYSLPTPVKALSMMKLIPQDVHCGDKFTIILAKPIVSKPMGQLTEMSSGPRLPISRFYCIPTPGDRLSGKYSDTWFRNQITKYWYQPKEQIGANESSAIYSIGQLSQYLLSLVAAECNQVSSRNKSIQHIDWLIATQKINSVVDEPFAVECSTSTFVHLLNLLEMKTECLIMTLDGLEQNGYSEYPSMSNSVQSPSVEDYLASRNPSVTQETALPLNSWVEARQEGDFSIDLTATVSYLLSVISVLTSNLVALKRALSISKSAQFVNSKSDSKLDLFDVNRDGIKSVRKGGIPITGFRRFLDNPNPTDYGESEGRVLDRRDDEGASEDGMDYSSEDSDDEVIAYGDGVTEPLDQLDYGVDNANSAYSFDLGFRDADAAVGSSAGNGNETEEEQNQQRQLSSNSSGSAIQFSEKDGAENGIDHQNQQKITQTSDFSSDIQSSSRQGRSIFDIGSQNSSPSRSEVEPSTGSIVHFVENELSLSSRRKEIDEKDIRNNSENELIEVSPLSINEDTIVTTPLTVVPVSAEPPDPDPMQSTRSVVIAVDSAGVAVESIYVNGTETVPDATEYDSDTNHLSRTPADESFGNDGGMYYGGDYQDGEYGDDMMELQTALLRSMEEVGAADNSAFEEYSYALKCRLEDPSSIIPSFKECLQAIALQTFKPVAELFENPSNLIEKPSVFDPTTNLLLLSLWMKIQSVIAQGFSVLFSASDQENLFLKVSRSPEECVHILPGLIEGSCLESPCYNPSIHAGTEDVLVALEFCRQFLAFSTTRTNILTFLTLLSTLRVHPSNINDLNDKDQLCCHIWKCHQSISKSYFHWLRLVLVSIISTFVEIEGEILSTEKVTFIQKIFSMLSTIIENELMELCSDVFLGINCLSQDCLAILDNTFSAFFLSLPSSVFPVRRCIQNSSLFLPYACNYLKLFQALHNKITTPSDNLPSSTIMREWLEQKFRWNILFVSSCIHTLSYPKLVPRLGSCRWSLSRSSRIVDGNLLVANSTQVIGINERSWWLSANAVFDSYSNISECIIGDNELLPSRLATDNAGFDFASFCRDHDSLLIFSTLIRSVFDIMFSHFDQKCWIRVSPKYSKHVHFEVFMNSLIRSDPNSNQESSLVRLQLSLFLVILASQPKWISIPQVLSFSKEDILNSESILWSWCSSIFLSAIIADLIVCDCSVASDSDTLSAVIDDVFQKCAQLLLRPLVRINFSHREAMVLKLLNQVVNDSGDSGCLGELESELISYFSAIRKMFSHSNTPPFRGGQSESADLLFGDKLHWKVDEELTHSDKQSFLVDLVLFAFSSLKMEQVDELACLQELTMRCKGSALLILAMALHFTKDSPSLQTYFSESLQTEFDGNDNILDWTHQPSWIGQINHTMLPSRFASALSMRSNKLITDAFRQIDEILVRQIGSLQSSVDIPTPSSELNKFPDQGLLLHLMGIFNQALHLYSNFALTVLPLKQHIHEPASITSFTKLISSFLNTNQFVVANQVGKFLHLPEICFGVLDSVYRSYFPGVQRHLNFDPCLLNITLQSFAKRLVELITRYQALLKFTIKMEIKLLLPVAKDLLSTSPTILPGVLSSDGNYTLGFWIKVSRQFANLHAPQTMLHVMSRVPETSDYNLLSLVSNESGNTCNPCVMLRSDENGNMVMEISVNVISNPSSAGGKPMITTMSVRSRTFPVDEWTLCTIEHKQKSSKTVSFTSAIGEHPKRKVSRTERCTLTLVINGVVDGTAEIIGGQFHPYQNIVLGTMPTVVGHSNSNRDGTVLLSTVFWSSTPSPDNGITPEEIEVDFINKTLFEATAQNPPNVLQEEIQEMWSISARLLEAMCSAFQALLNNQQSLFEIPAEDLRTIFGMIPYLISMICLGEEKVQDNAIQFINLFSSKWSSLRLSGQLQVRDAEIQDIVVCLVTLVEDITFPSAITDDQSFGTGGNLPNSISEHQSKVYLLWKRRLHFCNKVDKKSAPMYPVDMNSKFPVNENMLITGLSSILNNVIKAKIDLPQLVARESFRDVLQFLVCTCAGGWPSTASINRVVDITPRALFLRPDPKGLEQVLFPAQAIVMHVSNSRPGIWLRNCIGAYSRSSVADILVPRSPLTILPSTEMITAQDPFSISCLADVFNQFKDFRVPAADDLSRLLRLVVSGSYVATTAQPQRPASPMISPQQGSIQIIYILSQLRSFLTQLSLLSQQKEDDRAVQIQNLSFLLSSNMNSIFSIANVDPVEIVTMAFDGGAYKGAQLDVLRNLLREGDITFLEKISLRLWREIMASNSASQLFSASKKSAIDDSLLHMVTVAGDVQVTGTKIRALAHFPTVKLAGVGLEKMTGRWFYECTLLSDGLMQVGWATSLFRCDPTCGQGTGDHVHSWAFDGLRSKKWNVSCEPYGMRWKQGDMIGVLIDMDLLEMRFYLNGEDLGPAFVNFPTNDIFPALSLNVRQGVRVNFGQYKFAYPPDEIDGKAYRSIKEYVLMHHNRQGTNFNDTSSSKSRVAATSQNPPLQSEQSEATKHNVSMLDNRVAHSFLARDQGNDSVAASAVASIAEANVNAVLDRVRARIALESEFGSVGDDAATGMGETHNEGLAFLDDGMEADPLDKWMDYTGDHHTNEEDDDDGDDDDQSGGDADIDNECDGEGDVDGDDAGQGDAEDANNEERIELNRQSMVENLIGMGFPVEWALRAAAHCDPSASESVAIAWIIERMELEHNKMADLGGDSSRNADEEYDDGEDSSLEYLMHRHANSLTTGGNGNVYHSDRLTGVETNLSNTQHVSATLGNLTIGAALLTSPPRDEKQNVNVKKPLSASGGYLVSDPKTSKSTDISGDVDWVTGHTTENCGGWDADISYPPVLIGHYTARHRHDMDKQEVLSQIQELEAADMIPIIASCQFSLCVFYARALLMRAFAVVCRPRHIHLETSITLGSTEVSIPTEQLSVTLLALSRLHTMIFEEIVIKSPPSEIIRLMKVAFKQYIGLTTQPDRLFPCMSNANTVGDLRERVPFVDPFFNAEDLSGLFSPLLACLESRYFKDSIASLSVEDSSVQGTSSLASFLQSIIKHAFDYHHSCPVSSLGQACSNLLLQLFENCLNCLEDGCRDGSDDKDWISTSLERDENIENAAKAGAKGGKDYSSPKTGTAPVLWAYTVLRSMLVHSLNWKCSIWTVRDPESKEISCPPSSPSKSSNDSKDPIAELLSSTTLTRLLKIAAVCPNRSIKFCAFDVSALILARLNAHLVTLSQENNRKSLCVDGPEDCAHSAVEPDSVGQVQLAAEYYVSVAKEKRLLQIFGSRLRTESSRRILFSRYSRSIAAFLLQWQILRRLLGLGSDSVVRKYIGEDWTVGTTTKSFSSNVLSQGGEQVQAGYDFDRDEKSLPNSAPEKTMPLSLNKLDVTNEQSPPPAITRQELEVVQISPNSITIIWSLDEGRFTNIQQMDELTGSQPGFGVFVTQASNMGLESPILVKANIDSQGSHRIENLDPDTLYKISIVRGDKLPEFVFSSAVEGEEFGGRKEGFGALWQDSKFNDEVNSARGDSVGGGWDSQSSSCTSPVDHIVGDLTKFQELSILASTEAETMFLLDNETLSPNLVMSSDNLTLRNIANKKWSTARAAFKMTSGLYKWDVHVDRCVSKNIFIGIITAEGKLDNYVGCDIYGWGFLANRAIWHKKCKFKNYGELFKTGDTITVMLDLDVGTLGFMLNGENLGVAVEGLSGAFYPAFSLYNEDDQLSVITPRSPLDAINWSAGSAERVLDRMDALQELLAYLRISSKNDDTSIAQDSFSSSAAVLGRSLTQELRSRLKLWFKGINLRSVMWKNDFVVIVGSATLCRRYFVTEVHFVPGDIVTIDNEPALLLGAGNHRLWFEICSTRDIVGYCKDSINALIASDSIVIFRKNSVPQVSVKLRSWSRLITVSTDATNAIGSDSINPDADLAENFAESGELSIAIKGSFLPIDPPSPLAPGSPERNLDPSSTKKSISLRKGRIVDVSRALHIQQNAWSRRDDELLIEWLNIVIDNYGGHPSSLPLSVLIRSRENILTSFDRVQGEQKPNIIGKEVISYFGTFLSMHSEEDIVLRSMVMLHLNDQLLPLLPLISCNDNKAPENHPASLILGMKYLLLYKVKSQFAVYASRLIASNAVPVIDTTSLRDKAPLEGETGSEAVTVSNHLVLEILDELTAADIILKVATSNSTQDAHAAPVIQSLGALLILQSNTSWRLIAGFQASYVGQLYQYLEMLSTCKHTYPNDQTFPDNSCAWENILRCNRVVANSVKFQSHFQSASGELTFFASLAEHGRQSLPFLIRLGRVEGEQSKVDFPSTGNSVEEIVVKHGLLKDLKSDSPRSLLLRMLEVKQICGLISEHQIFEVFVEEAFGQITRLMESIFGPIALAEENTESFSGSTVESRIIESLADISYDAALVICSFTAGDCNLILQIMHVVGVLLGIKIRYNLACPLVLPNFFSSLLASPTLSSGGLERLEHVLLGLYTNPSSDRFTLSGSPHTGLDHDSIKHTYRVAVAMALAVRHGVTCIVPEASLCLWQESDIVKLLNGSNYCTSINFLRRHAEYCSRVNSFEKHIICFWTALGELSGAQLKKFLRHIWGINDCSEELWHFPYTRNLPAPFLIDSPTFHGPVSELDSMDITMVKQSHTLCLPRYSTYQIMAKNLFIFVELLPEFA